MSAEEVGREQAIVVVFDVNGQTREQAATRLVDAIDLSTAGGGNPAVRQALTEAGVVSWWLAEADVKHVDGNDNADMHLELDDYDKYRGSKFSSARDEVLHAMTMVGWGTESSGDVMAPTGHFSRVSNELEEMDELMGVFDDEAREAGLRHTHQLIGHFLVAEDNDGRVLVQKYDNAVMLERVYNQLERRYADWLDQDD